MAPRILIVDDRASIRKLLRVRIQAERGWSVCAEASDGREAIQVARQFRPNLVVMDLFMPVMNGFEAARILRRLVPSVPLIMFTSFSTRSLEAQAYQAGFSRVVLKTQPWPRKGTPSPKIVVDSANLRGFEELKAEMRMRPTQGVIRHSCCKISSG
jgi:CheY-like chemotaxis protein